MHEGSVPVHRSEGSYFLLHWIVPQPLVQGKMRGTNELTCFSVWDITARNDLLSRIRAMGHRFFQNDNNRSVPVQN